MPRPLHRSVFISFLGLGNYTEVVYPDPLGREDVAPAPATPYVQEAFLHYLKLSGYHPHVYIFVTEGARGKHFDPPGTLADRLVRTGLEITPVDIDDPGDEASVWRTFQRVVDVFRPNDHIWFDVTHAFRVLPMLGIVALNYVKALKHVEVEGIWYGDYDTFANPPRPAGSRDVTSFVAIQDWANATRALTQRGSVRELTDLSGQAIDLFRKRDAAAGKGVYTAFVELKRRLVAIAEALELANAHALLSGDDWSEVATQFERLSHRLNVSQSPAAKPVVDLLAVAESKLSQGVHPDRRPVAAVEWAAEHGLVQQGFTMLSELITTALCERLKIDVAAKPVRDFVSGYLKFKRTDHFDAERYELPDDLEATALLQKLAGLEQIDEWRRLASTIAEPRNALNHAGYDRRSGHLNYASYNKQLKRALTQFEELTVERSTQ